METRDRAKTRHTSVETEPLKDRGMKNHETRHASRDSITVHIS